MDVNIDALKDRQIDGSRDGCECIDGGMERKQHELKIRDSDINNKHSIIKNQSNLRFIYRSAY